jgi:hypothetical protein
VGGNRIDCVNDFLCMEENSCIGRLRLW